MPYNKLKYNGVTGITALGGVEDIVTITLPAVAYENTFSLDVYISSYGGASIPECSSVARYISLYSISSLGVITFKNKNIICEKISDLIGSVTWDYSEFISGSSIIIQLDTSNWYNTYCLYDIILEF
jgi:hypothetical protein